MNGGGIHAWPESGGHLWQVSVSGGCGGCTGAGTAGRWCSAEHPHQSQAVIQWDKGYYKTNKTHPWRSPEFNIKIVKLHPVA